MYNKLQLFDQNNFLFFKLNRLLFQFPQHNYKSSQQNNHNRSRERQQFSKRMTEITSKQKVNNNQRTKTSGLNPKSAFSLSDLNKQYRRQQNYKKKLKTLIQTNFLLQQRIKIFQSTIKDERGSILFQLNQLIRTMNTKVSTYTQQRFDKDRFRDNQTSLQTIKQMIAKFQVVEKQSKVTKKVYQSMNDIHQRYLAYSDEIDDLVKMTKKTNKQYEDGMKSMLEQKHMQIMSKRQQSEELYDNTQWMIKKIDDLEAGRLELINEEIRLQQQIKNLNQVQSDTKKKVQKFNEWAQIVIDKNHRKVFNKESKQKEVELAMLQANNKGLEIYLREIENQEELVKEKLKEKENQLQLLKVPQAAKPIKKKKTRKQTYKSVNHV